MKNNSSTQKKNNRKISFFLTFFIFLFIFSGLYFIQFGVKSIEPEELNLDFLSAIQGDTRESADQKNKESSMPAQYKSQETAAAQQEKPQEVVKNQSNTITQKDESILASAETKQKKEEPEPQKTKPKFAFSEAQDYEKEEPVPVEKKTKSKTGISSEQGGAQGTAAQPFGVEGELKGRGIHRVPNLNSNCYEKGTVVIDVTVNQKGEVVYKLTNYKETTTTASCLINEALAIVQKMIWEESNIENMSGSVQFNFQ